METKVSTESDTMRYVLVFNDQFAAFAFIAKKSGHNIDAKTSEKITDGARGLFEKFTGYVFPVQWPKMNESVLIVSQKES
jgi:hypothetical protein